MGHICWALLFFWRSSIDVSVNNNKIVRQINFNGKIICWFFPTSNSLRIGYLNMGQKFTFRLIMLRLYWFYYNYFFRLIKVLAYVGMEKIYLSFVYWGLKILKLNNLKRNALFFLTCKWWIEISCIYMTLWPIIYIMVNRLNLLVTFKLKYPI